MGSQKTDTLWVNYCHKKFIHMQLSLLSLKPYSTCLRNWKRCLIFSWGSKPNE